MPKFTPPIATLVPVISPVVPKWKQRPFAFFKPSIPRGANVWFWTNGIISTSQPPVWIATNNQPGVAKVYYGGRTYDISNDEAAILANAGFGDNIVY